MGETITKNDYLALVGLMELARRHNEALADVVKAAEAITGDMEGGHTADECYDSRPSADALLERLEIEVSDERP